jgi:hypothetical protein
LTPEQAVRVRAAIGDGQYVALWDACQAVTNDKKITVPFSPAASAVLATRDS